MVRFKHSVLDSRRFGRRIFRAEVSAVGEVSELDLISAENGAELVITRCPVAAGDVVHALEEQQHRLMDTLIYFEGSTERGATPPMTAYQIREARPEDREALRLIAEECFAGYLGHYHADSRLDPNLATAGYVEWCLSSLDTPDHVVLVATSRGRVTGFLILRRPKAQEAAEIVLNGVAAAERGRGIYSALLGQACRLLADSGVGMVQISTQISNFVPQRVWCRHALRPIGANYTFHKWFEQPAGAM